MSVDSGLLVIVSIMSAMIIVGNTILIINYSNLYSLCLKVISYLAIVLLLFDVYEPPTEMENSRLVIRLNKTL